MTRRGRTGSGRKHRLGKEAQEKEDKLRKKLSTERRKHEQERTWHRNDRRDC